MDKCLIALCNITDWISIGVDIVTGGLVAYILACIVPKKLNDDRALKDFFIDEMRDLKDEYNDFCKNMCLDNLSASIIKESFKQFSIRVIDAESCINRELDVNISTHSFITDCQILVTGSTEINEMFDRDKVSFEHTTKSQIINKQDLFNRNIMSAIASINKSNKK